MDVAERVKNLFEDSEITQTAFAQKYGMSKNSLNGYLNGHRKLPYDILILIAEHFQVTADYLLGIVDEPGRPFRLSQGERELVVSYRTLSAPQKEIIRGSINIMCSQNNQ